MASFPFRIAKRYLWARKGEASITVITAIAVLGVAVGVMTINIVMAVMTGFEVELREKILGADSHIVVNRIQSGGYDWRESKRKIQNVPGVQSVSAFTNHRVLLKIGDRAEGVFLRGVEKESAGEKQLISYVKDAPSDIFATEATADADVPPVVIGRELAQTLGAYTGSFLSVLSTDVASTPFGLVPRFRRFVVSSVYSSGLVEYERGLAYIRLQDAQQFFRLGDVVQGFEVRVNDLDAAHAISRDILAKLGGASSGFTARDWTETNRPFFEALQLEKRVYFLVLLLIVVMASFSIVGSLVMVVLEKRKDIAVMRTLGASATTIRRIFQIQGAIIGGIGVSSGLIGGFVGCLVLKTYGFPIDQRIFQMSTLPIHIEPINFAMSGIAAFAICCVATWYPSKRASGLDPVTVMRFE